jgi:hypothetical protein
MISYASEQFARNADRALIIIGGTPREGATIIQNEAPILYQKAIEIQVYLIR